MATHRDVERGDKKGLEKLAEPFIDDSSKGVHRSKQTDQNAAGSIAMVLLSTAVAVCGSLEFGTCVS